MNQLDKDKTFGISSKYSGDWKDIDQFVGGFT
jgi:hypothetical protein